MCFSVLLVLRIASRVRISGADHNKENHHPTTTTQESYDNVPDYDNVGDDSSDEESIRWRDDDESTQSKFMMMVNPDIVSLKEAVHNLSAFPNSSSYPDIVKIKVNP